MLNLYLLGMPRLELDRKLVSIHSRKGWSLLAYLIDHSSQGATRQHVATELWQEANEHQARKRLNTTFWRIRNAVRQAGFDPDGLFDSTGNTLNIRPGAPISVDVHEFHNAITLGNLTARALSGEEIANLKRAAGLYRAEFLAGIDDEWCLITRESLRAQFLSVLDRLLRHYIDQAAWAEVVEAGSRLLQEDPLLENVHRALIRAYGEMNDRTNVHHQFELCARLLGTELDVEPMPETQIAFETALGRPMSPLRANSNLLEADLTEALEHLNIARSVIARLRTRTKS